jgi:hypothetical protein
LSCQTSKQEGESYAAADWVKAAKHTDDQRAIEAENNAIDYTDGQIDQVQNEISQRELSIFRQDTKPTGNGFVVGQLWIRTTDFTFFRWTGSVWEQFTPSVSSVDGINNRLSIAEFDITELDNEVSLDKVNARVRSIKNKWVFRRLKMIIANTKDTMNSQLNQ